MKIDENGKNLIKKYEQFRSYPYQDHGKGKGVWTQGWGHTRGVTANSPPLKYTKDENGNIHSPTADKWFDEDITRAENTIKRYVKVPLNQNQHNATTSFVFNAGGLHNLADKHGNRTETGFLKRLNNYDYTGAFQKELPRWIHSKGVVMNGLIKRRNEESNLAMTPVDDYNNQSNSMNHNNNMIQKFTNPKNDSPSQNIIQRLLSAL